MNIFVDTEELKEKANSITEVAFELNENMNMIENLILNLGVEWHGKAEIAFAAKILFVKKQFETLYDFIIDYSETIKSIVNDYEDTENQLLLQMEA
ncbi:MAG: WXG100 family type VII secretion target [Eubacterium sp.]|nr:WXG100 family type VII secretion target [Eubacterium sp.]